MNITVNWRLLNEARYNMKVKKLCRKMTECMEEEDIISCAESTRKVLRLLPDSLKEPLIDKLIQTIDNTKEWLEKAEDLNG